MVTRRSFLKTAGASAATFGFPSVFTGCAPGPSGGAPAVRFGFITDCHYAAHLGKPSCGRHYAESLAKMNAFVEAMNAEAVDFAVEGGDFKDLGRTPEESLRYLDEIEGAFARFRGPRYHVLGNHDHDNLTKDEFLAHVTNAGERAEPWYAFTRGGIRFIVLDACFRPDGQPYSRGHFNWKKAFVPPVEVAFLKRELAAAKEPCVVLLHQQLDAEDETVIANAAEVRRVLEESGKVRFVLQGHFHEGSFREINGIGYFTAKANVVGAAPAENAFAVVSVWPDGSVAVTGSGGESAAATRSAARADGWEGAPKWEKGHYQVHFIYTGRGESMLHLFPDGTSMLVDCGDSMRFHGTPQEVPLLPDLSRRAGEWVARYVKRVNPHGAKVDYFHLSHYHEDHLGAARWNDGCVSAPTGDYWKCGLADAARFLSFGKVVDRAWPAFDDPLPVFGVSRAGEPEQARAVYGRLAATQGTEIEFFRLGARDQFVPLHDASAAKDFEIFNLCANGRYVRRDGSVRDLYADRVKAGAKTFNENGMSCGFVVRYGAFSFFSAGDFSDGGRHQIEEDLAEAVGPVSVAKANHHGHHSMYPALVKALRARVWTACVLDQQHMTDDTCMRLADRTLYGGPRTILPTYMPLDRPATAAGRAFLSDVPAVVRREPCHVVLDVPPGGGIYSLSCVRAADESGRLLARFGFFS